MIALLRIAARNLLRYRRRTLLTSTLICLGVVAVLLFISVAGSFRSMMIGQLTDAMLGHLQIHRRGYVESIDSLPLNLNFSASESQRLLTLLDSMDSVQASSPRIKFGAMLSNYSETTNIRLSAVDPPRERATVPLLMGRLLDGSSHFISRASIFLPELLARGMNVKLGDSVVLVATNRDGSVNGMSFTVAGIVEALSGPGGRDGYIHIEDARQLLRLDEAEVSEIAVRLRHLSDVPMAMATLRSRIRADPKLSPKKLEVHPWRKLTPFSNIARMIDLLTLFVQIMLVSIVLISVMNVMIMAVYERIREIGTIAAIGVRPRTIMGLFLTEGMLLGLIGSAAGILLSLLSISLLNTAGLTFSFGRQESLLLQPSLQAMTVIWIAAGVLIVSIVASLQPAIKASRMDPIKALRHV